MTKLHEDYKVSLGANMMHRELQKLMKRDEAYQGLRIRRLGQKISMLFMQLLRRQRHADL